MNLISKKRFGVLKNNVFKIPILARLFRHKFSPIDFLPEEKLYRSYFINELPVKIEPRKLKASFLSFPNISCNWSRFYKPEDVIKRSGGSPKAGCLSFTVEQARYHGKIATCHDPNPPSGPKNYSHSELRQLLPSEDQFKEPPKDRAKLETEKDGWSRRVRLEYRNYIAKVLNIEIEPLA
jgi:hypothetical protein